MAAGEQLYFGFNLNYCSGCFACVIACQQWHGLGGEISLRRVVSREFDFPEPLIRFFSFSCMHCARPACVDVCPVGANQKLEASGVVVHDADLCVGCQACIEACPVHAPQYNARTKKVLKCDFCYDRLESNREPICVQTCPTGALVVGSRAGLGKQGYTERECPGFSLSLETSPSVLFSKTRVTGVGGVKKSERG